MESPRQVAGQPLILFHPGTHPAHLSVTCSCRGRLSVIIAEACLIAWSPPVRGRVRLHELVEGEIGEEKKV